MLRVVTPFLVGVFLFSSIGGWAKQTSQAPAVADSEHQAISNDPQRDARGCGGFYAAILAARQNVEQDRRDLQAAADPSDPTVTVNGESSPGKLQHDLSILNGKVQEFNACAASNTRTSAIPVESSVCSSEPLLNFPVSHRGEPEGEIPIWHLPGSPAFFYSSGMTIDADGAPNAYHPDNTGLDDLRNAGAPGYWEGLAKDRDGEPFVQGPDDPFPGYYVSETALADRSKPMNDPSRYVNASKIPFIVLPGNLARDVGARPGDFAAVFNQGNGKSSYAIFGDVGPFDRIGEGSIALAENLGIRSDARNGGARRGIVFIVFPGSGNGQPRTVEEINAETEKLVQEWGGSSQLTACTVPQAAASPEGVRNPY